MVCFAISPNNYKQGRITQTFHDEIATELKKKQQELNDRLKLLTSDNKDFQVTASYLLDVAQRAGQLFNGSDEGLTTPLEQSLRQRKRALWLIILTFGAP